MMRIRAAAGFLAGLWLLTQALAQDRPASIAATLADVDWSVILRSFRIKGVLFCPDPCVYVENAFPVGIFEVTRREFHTNLAELQPLLKPFKQKPSSHSDSQDRSDSTLQFAEAHVFEFVPPIDLGFLAKPSGAPLALNYLSEVDRWAWRNPAFDWLVYPMFVGILCDGGMGPLRACAGPWGNYYPRHGFVTRDSEVMAAYLQALRAGRAASGPGLRIVPKSYPFEPRTGHYIQMVSPVRRAAVTIGNRNIAAIEAGAGAKDGTYRFVHFGVFEACRGCVSTRLVGDRAP
jgi:hypothetical protein